MYESYDDYPQELDIIRSELLKKFKIAEEREIKKPHIVL